MNIQENLDPLHDLFLYNWSEKNSTDTTLSILEKNINCMNDEQKSAWTLSWKPQNEAFARESQEEDSLAIFKYQRFLKNYLRCLLALDENIGRLFDRTEDVSNTQSYFIYFSERGSFTGEFGWFGSEWMYEPSSRIPFILSPINESTPTPVELNKLLADTDFYQFIKALCSTTSDNKNPITNEVYDLISLDKEIYFTQNILPSEYHVALHHGLRKGRYKIIHYHPFNEWEFYDLEVDPNEEKNLIKNPDLSELITEYRDLLKQAAESSNYPLHKKEFSEHWKRKQRSPNKKTR
jgi:arylsulfatase A-like enzyme